jgi:signal transduction histidine kinase
VHALLDHVAKMMLPLVRNKSIDFLVTLEENLPIQLIGDAMRTRRILMSLIANAIKFTEKGAVKVHVEVVDNANSAGKIRLRFKITDTGIGISEYDQGIILGRIHPSSKGVDAGNGIGFRMVKQYLEELDGQLQVESVLGKGATFSILIPYQTSLRSEVTKKPVDKTGKKHTVIKNISAGEQSAT